MRDYRELVLSDDRKATYLRTRHTDRSIALLTIAVLIVGETVLPNLTTALFLIVLASMIGWIVYRWRHRETFWQLRKQEIEAGKKESAKLLDEMKRLSKQRITKKG